MLEEVGARGREVIVRQRVREIFRAAATDAHTGQTMLVLRSEVRNELQPATAVQLVLKSAGASFVHDAGHHGIV